MRKYILHYFGGSKGDFLCNFINNSSFIEETSSFNKSQSLIPYFKSLQFKEFNYYDALNCLKNDDLIFPGHCCYKIPKKFIIKSKVQIIDFFYEKKFHKTILIERAFKNFSKILNEKEKINYLRMMNLSVLPDEFNSIYYYADIFLVRDKLKVNDINRAAFLKTAFEKESIFYKSAYQSVVIDYERIFFKKDFSILKNYFEFDEDRLFELIEKTWLPEEIDLFGTIWKPKDFGYLTP